MTALHKDNKAFVVHMTSPAAHSEMSIYPSWAAQIASLIADKAPVTLFPKYSDYTNVFSPGSAAELPKHTRINNHPIVLIDSQQPPYGPIYSLGPVELETLKTYIETNLANGFIRPSKSPAGVPILFV